MLLFASFSGAFGGAERLLVDFAQAFDEPCVIACPEGPLAQAARKTGLTVFTVRARPLSLRGGPGAPVRALARLTAYGAEVRRLVRGLDPGLVVAWGIRPGLACLFGTPLRRPVVFHHNDLLPGPLVGSAVRIAAWRAERSIAASHAIAAELDPRLRLGDRLRVVHPGIDPDRFVDSPASVRPPEVLVLGAIVGWKRLDVALEACAIARRMFPDLSLRIVGAPLDEGGERLARLLRERAAELGFASLDGPAAEPEHELARASCLLHCAEREPFGMVVLEALAAGRPVVAPESGGPAEIVDPSCGVLYRPGDARAAADALDAVLADPERAQAMGAAGRERARTRFDLGRARARYAAAVKPLLEGRRPPVDRGAPASPGVTFVTVTHNSAAELRGLTASMRRHLPGVRLVVVDCDSHDDTLEAASAEPFVTLVALGENAGFGRGINRALREVDEPVTVIVNPDVELVDDSALRLADEAIRSDRLLAPLVLYPDGRRQDTVHPIPASAWDLVRSVVPPALLPGRLGVPLAPWRDRRPRRVGWAVACALAARTETLRALGPFDERIFLYGEDLELGLRAAQRGIETWFWPQTRVVHHRAHSSAREFGGEPFELLARARHDVVARDMGVGRARLDDTAQAITFALRAALKRALGRDAERERRQLDALARAARGAR